MSVRSLEPDLPPLSFAKYWSSRERKILARQRWCVCRLCITLRSVQMLWGWYKWKRASFHLLGVNELWTAGHTQWRLIGVTAADSLTLISTFTTTGRCRTNACARTTVGTVCLRVCKRSRRDEGDNFVGSTVTRMLGRCGVLWFSRFQLVEHNSLSVCMYTEILIIVVPPELDDSLAHVCTLKIKLRIDVTCAPSGSQTHTLICWGAGLQPKSHLWKEKDRLPAWYCDSTVIKSHNVQVQRSLKSYWDGLSDKVVLQMHILNVASHLGCRKHMKDLLWKYWMNRELSFCVYMWVFYLTCKHNTVRFGLICVFY